MIRLDLLGGFQVFRDGEEIPSLPSQPQRAGMLVAIAVEGSITREHLCSLLWPDSPTDRGRHALSQALYELKSDLGTSWVATKGNSLCTTEHLESDVRALEEAIERGDHDRALELYAGPFLDRVHLGGGVEFEHWIDLNRSRLHRRVRGSYRAAMDSASRPEIRAGIARDWIRFDPFDDEAHHALIESLAEAGNRAAALEHYQGYSETIAEELGLEPLDQTKVLVGRIRDGWSAGTNGPDRESVEPDSPADETRPEIPGAGDGPRAHADSRGAGSSRPPHPVPDSRSVAVLPFVNLSADPEAEYFTDGITDDIISALTLIEGLRVLSRTSSMQYKGTTKTTRRIAGELNAGVILEGSVRRDGDRVRIIAQLINANRDETLWAATYDRELQDVFAVQSDVAKHVADALQSRLSPRGRMRLAGRPSTTDVHAYQLVARARHAYLQISRARVDHGINLLRRALEIDPGYAEAWAHLAIAHFILPYFSPLPPPSVRETTREAIRRALELDRGLPEAYAARALWRFNYRFDWLGAEQDLHRALQLNPSSADAYSWRSLVHMMCRRTEESVEDARQAVALDPLSFQTRSQLAQNLTWAGRREEGAEILREIIADDPHNFMAHWALGVATSDPEQALVHFDDALAQMDVPLGHASRSSVLRRLGREAEADRIIANLEERAAGPEYVTPFALAVAYFGKGDLERGLDYLEQGVEAHDFMTLHFRIIAPTFRFDDHPRYRDLVHRVWPDEFPAMH